MGKGAWKGEGPKRTSPPTMSPISPIDIIQFTITALNHRNSNTTLLHIQTRLWKQSIILQSLHALRNVSAVQGVLRR